MIEEIKKRDGRIVEFDSSKITAAIAKAGQATGEFGERDAKKMTLRVLTLAHELRLGPSPDVEEIQDIVERVLTNANLEPSALIIEVTEAELLSQPRETREQLMLLSRLGVRVALDDLRRLVHDLAGRRVRRLASGWRELGEHRVTWRGRDDHGRALAYAARQAGVPCVICMSELVPQNKLDGIRALGAEARIYGKSQDEAEIEVDALPDVKLKGRVTEIANSAKSSGAGTTDEKTELPYPDDLDRMQAFGQ